MLMLMLVLLMLVLILILILMLMLILILIRIPILILILIVIPKEKSITNTTSNRFFGRPPRPFHGPKDRPAPRTSLPVCLGAIKRFNRGFVFFFKGFRGLSVLGVFLVGFRRPGGNRRGSGVQGVWDLRV